jgi:hypothetical protein
MPLRCPVFVENAFLKLPELLTSGDSPRDIFESTAVHLLAVAMLMELDSRNVSRAFEHVFTEKPYPHTGKDGRPIHADLQVSLEKAIPITQRMLAYGARELNWIEVKAYLGSIRRNARPPRTANCGRIVRDLIRLCILPKELVGSIRQNGRYMLLIFSDDPSESVALRKRKWLSSLLTEHYPDVRIDLADEPRTLRQAVGPGFVQSADVKMNLRLRTMMFKPAEETAVAPVFWGYLVRIQYFRIATARSEIEYRDQPGAAMDAGCVARLDAIREELLGRLGKEREDH